MAHIFCVFFIYFHVKNSSVNSITRHGDSPFKKHSVGNSDGKLKTNKTGDKKARIKSVNGVHLDFAKTIACFSLLAFMVFMLVKPDYYLTSARRGLSLFATNVLPSLFPFYFCSLMLTYMGAVKGISKLGAAPVKLFYNTPKESAYALFLSMLCGYPAGASTCEELYEAGILTKNDVKSTAAFCSTSGPVFMIGTIGGAIFNDARVGWIVLAAHYLGALLNGLIYRKRASSSDDRTFALNVDVDSFMAQAISKSTINMLYVGGYIVICGMLVDTLELIGLRNLFSAFDNTGALTSIIYGLIEMTRGCLECSNCSSIHLSAILCTSAVSFGGLSVTLQNYTFLSKCGLKFPEIILRKTTQCAISAFIAFLLGFAL